MNTNHCWTRKACQSHRSFFVYFFFRKHTLEADDLRQIDSLKIGIKKKVSSQFTSKMTWGRRPKQALRAVVILITTVLLSATHIQNVIWAWACLSCVCLCVLSMHVSRMPPSACRIGCSTNAQCVCHRSVAAGIGWRPLLRLGQKGDSRIVGQAHTDNGPTHRIKNETYETADLPLQLIYIMRIHTEIVALAFFYSNVVFLCFGLIGRHSTRQQQEEEEEKRIHTHELTTRINIQSNAECAKTLILPNPKHNISQQSHTVTAIDVLCFILLVSDYI